MKRMILCLFVMIAWVGVAQAQIYINEVLADPPTGLIGDANNDGSTSSTQDEFIELINLSNQSVNISGWTISDAVKTRHIFLPNTFIDPLSFFVVFGGGLPNHSNFKWQLASTGTLGLNNSGDTIQLASLNNDIIDLISYGSEGGKDQSLVRSVEGELSDFILHSELSNTDNMYFSPGTKADGTEFLEIVSDSIDSAHVPEPLSIISFLFGSLFMLRWHKL